jgi:hypothetical protein
MTTWPPGRSSRHAAHSASRCLCTLLKHALKNTASTGPWAAGKSTMSPHQVCTCAAHLRSSQRAAAAKHAHNEASMAWGCKCSSPAAVSCSADEQTATGCSRPAAAS